MRVSAWYNGKSTYGIYVGKWNRDKYFHSDIKEIEVMIDRHFYSFKLTSSFWNNCPEFRDRNEPVIREWLKHHCSLNWRHGQPPKMELVQIGKGRRFSITLLEG
jgi:hypothetical protein